jgi:hypothetical protein
MGKQLSDAALTAEYVMMSPGRNDGVGSARLDIADWHTFSRAGTLSAILECKR